MSGYAHGVKEAESQRAYEAMRGPPPRTYLHRPLHRPVQKPVAPRVGVANTRRDVRDTTAIEMHDLRAPSPLPPGAQTSKAPDLSNYKGAPSGKYTLMDVDAVLEELQTNAKTGLYQDETIRRQILNGKNEMPKEEPESAARQFLKQFSENPLILLLFGSVAVSFLIGNYDDAVSILVAVLIVVTVGFVQEQKSQKALDALEDLVPPRCVVVRNDGGAVSLPAADLVVGDIVLLRTGDRVPADCRIIESSHLQVDESSLTGETEPVEKRPEPVVNTRPEMGSVTVNEMVNITFMGTLVRQGTARAVVVGTGSQTEFGQIFTMMQSVDDRKTPLQQSMNDLAHKLSVASFGIIGCICVIGWLQSRSWIDMFTIGVSLAVAAIPEGLPIVVSVTLALGVHRMAKRHVIVKKLPSVEALGSVSVICSDKTGTITTNQLTVTHAFTVDDDVFPVDSVHNLSRSSDIAKHDLFLYASLVSHAEHGSVPGELVGQSTDIALVKMLANVGLEDRRGELVTVGREIFSSDKKYQSFTGHLGPKGPLLTITVGAIEVTLSKCRFYMRSSGHTSFLDDQLLAQINAKAQSLAQNGLRIIAVTSGSDPTQMVFMGLLALIDPPRKGVANAISTLAASGVRVVMITGDSAHTAQAICKQVNIPVSTHTTLDGRDIDALSDRQLTELAPSTLLFSRVTPRHKLRIVQALQAHRQVVAMTGDGVNDAPALKQADIGLSMGLSGTDVAKEAADIILVLDNLATLVPAVEEGKTIFLNVQNFLAFQLSTAVATLALIFLSTMLRLPNPLNAMQILFINILMDGPPSQSLGVDPVSPRVSRCPPRPQDQTILSKQLIVRIIFSASLVVTGVLMVFGLELSQHHLSLKDAELAVGPKDLRHQTMTFAAFVFLDLVSALQNRGIDVGILSGNVNKMLVTTVSLSALVLMALIYVPFAQNIFHTEALSLKDLGTVLGLACGSFLLHELRRRHEMELADQDALSRSMEVV